MKKLGKFQVIQLNLKIELYTLNVTSISEDRKKLIKYINNKFLKIDILINNAALTGDQLLIKTKKKILK